MQQQDLSLTDPARPYDWDVFVSYASREKPWVRRVVRQWRDLGLKVFFDEDTANPGEPVPDLMDRAVHGSRHVVCMLSNAAADSEYVALELSLARAADPAGKERRLIPVLLEALPQDKLRRVQHLNFVRLNDRDIREMEYQRLLRSLLPPNAQVARMPPMDGDDGDGPPAASSAQLPYDDGFGHGAAVAAPPAVATDAGAIEVVLNREFAAFTPNEQAKFLSALEDLLGISDVRIVRVRRGSVRVTLELPRDEGERLIQAVERGELLELDVVAARRLDSAVEMIPLSVPIVGGDSGTDRRRKVPVRPDETREEALRSATGDGRTKQGSLLVMAPITGDVERLKEVLAEIADNDPEDNYLVPFMKLRTVHFARFVVHEAAPDDFERNFVHGPPIPPKLLFSTDYDGTFEDHVAELLREVGPGLDTVFRFCAGYPPEGHRDERRVRDWMLLHRVPSNTFYTGTMGRSVLQIRREAGLRDAIEGFLDRAKADPTFPADPVAVHGRVRAFVSGHPDLQWVKVRPGPFPRPKLPRFLTSTPVLFGTVLLLLIGLPLLLGFLVRPLLPFAVAFVALLVAAVAGSVAYVRYLEKRDPVLIRNDKEHVKDLVRTEDHIVQNEMSSVIYIKEPLWFRRILLSAVLRFIDFGARKLSVEGQLAGIPSIHFARWVIVDGGRRLVFFSNFDGSWENYLGDFIDKASTGLTGVWTHCLGFPRTRFVFFAGAAQEQKFKQYSRDSQVPTQVWYSAYKWLSVDNINNNTKIRLGLYEDMTPEAAREWLRRF